MNYSQVDNIVGYPQIQFAGLVADTTPRVQPGNFLSAVDNWWGAGEFIYARAAGTIRMLGLVTLLPVFDSTLNSWRFDATEAPNTANLGKMVGVATNAFTSGQYGWFGISGLFPVNCTSSIAADTALGIVAAGQGGALAAGKQLLNARVVGAATTTVAKAGATANSGSTVLQVPNADGWFVGAYLSGTGIAAGTTVASIDPSGHYVTLSAATTALVNGTVTATYNNATIFYNIVHLNRPFLQGAIT